MNNKYIINPHVIVLSFDDNNYKNYILSKSETDIQPISYFLNNDNNVDCLGRSIIEIQKHIKISIVDISIHLLELHSKEIEKFYNTKKIVYPIYGAVIPYSEDLLNCFWKEYSFLESNPFSYSITRVAQNILIQ
jgi:hypothetical protein